jgi:hypothetical protein
MATRKGPKGLSNPISTSGEGDRFQARVQASYLLALLTGDARFGLPNQIVGLRFQARLDYHTDDLVCTVERDDGSTFVVAMQVKLTVKARAGDGPFKDAVTAAWYDFKTPLKFRPGIDRLVVAYAKDGGSDTLDAAAQVCGKARSSSTPEDLVRAALEKDYSSEPQREALAAIRKVVEESAGELTNEDLHQFCKHLWFEQHRLASDEAPDVSHAAGEIRRALGRHGHGGPSSVWHTLVSVCLGLNGKAATVTRDNVRDFIESARLVNDFERYRRSDVGPVDTATTQPSRLESREAPEASIDFAAPRATMGGPVVDSAELGVARQDSANRIITGQLEAINSLVKAFRYKDAQAQLSVIGQDLEPFDDYQKSRWYLLRATCAWHTGSVADASRDFLKAAELFPADERNAAAKIRGLLLADRIAEALEAGREALERFPESLFVWVANANAQILAGQVPQEASLPLAHRNSAEALQLIAAGLNHAKRLPEAAEVSLRSLAADKPGFYVRAAALSHVLDLASQDNVHVALRVLTAEHRAQLKAVTDAFEPRAERLWSVQSESAVSMAVANLGAAYLLQERPEEALEVAKEARAQQRLRPELVRVELEALHDTGQVAQMFRLGLASLADLREGGLVALAQVAANRGEYDVAAAVFEHAKTRDNIEGSAKEVLRATRWLALWNSKQQSVLAAELADFDPQSTDNSALLASVARLALVIDKAKSEAALKRLSEVVGDKPPSETRLLLADLYSDLKDFQQAARFYESVLPKEGLSELHRRLLFCLLRSGNRRKAKDLLARLPNGWTADDDLRSMASELARDAGDWPLLSQLAEAQFARNPGETSSWLFKYMVNSRELPAADLKSFIEQAPLELEGTVQQAAQLAYAEFQLGLHAKGSLRLYRMRRLHGSKIESASALLIAYLAYNKHVPGLHDSPCKAAPGAHVTLEGPGGISHITIDPQGLQGLPEDTEFFSPTAPFVQEFLGKAPGDEVHLDGGFGGPRIFKVVAVSSAYDRQLGLAHAQIETSLEPPPNLWTLRMRKGPDGEPDLTELQDNLRRQREQIEKSLKVYQEHPLTLGGLARMIGRDAVELVQGWPSGADATPLLVCEGNAVELEQAQALLVRAGTGFLVDAPTLAELVRLDALDALAALPSVFATTETEEILRLKVESLKDKGTEGRLLDDNGQMRFIEFTAKDKEFALKQAQAAVDALERYCKVVPAYGPENKPEFLEHVERILSREERSVLTAALEHNLSLLSTDLRLRQMAAQMKIEGAWPQVLLQFAVSKGVVTQRRWSHAVIRLLVSNRSFVPITPEDLLELCQQSTDWVRFVIERLKIYLSKPTVEFDSTYSIVRAFLVLAGARGMRLAALAELIRHLFEGIMRHKDASSETARDLLETLRTLVTSSLPYPYPALVEHEERMSEAQFKFLGRAVVEAAGWAQGEPQKRPVRLVVHFVTKNPLLMYDPLNEPSPPAQEASEEGK